MVNYQNGMIYKLCCNDLNITDIYIGSTVNFKERKRCHKKSCNNINHIKYNYKVYKFIRDNGGWNNWDMVLVAKTKCNSKLELRQFERKYYEELNATLNNNYPGRTQKEWVEKNKEILKIKSKNKINCPICNKLGRKSDIKRHQRSKKCIEASKID